VVVGGGNKVVGGAVSSVGAVVVDVVVVEAVVDVVWAAAGAGAKDASTRAAANAVASVRIVRVGEVMTVMSRGQSARRLHRH
jgi:hypothetical protein